MLLKRTPDQCTSEPPGRRVSSMIAEGKVELIYILAGWPKQRTRTRPKAANMPFTSEADTQPKAHLLPSNNIDDV
jgi:hypothetical protein